MDRSEYIKYVRLWQSVVIQAIQDSKRVSRKPEAMAAKRDAKLWVDSRDFLAVCEMAELNYGELNASIIRDIILSDMIGSDLRYVKIEH